MGRSVIRTHFGFTLAELLIALAVLGVIATFTIPKVLFAQADAKNKAIAKEAAAMVSGAYQAYQMEQAPGTSTRFSNLTQYMNYVKVDNTTIVDYVPTQPTRDCSIHVCLKLHNGAILWYWDTDAPFAGTTTTDAVNFFVDPDGTSVGANSPKAVQFFLYFNGRIASRATINNPTTADGTSFSPSSTFEPDWFAWN